MLTSMESKRLIRHPKDDEIYPVGTVVRLHKTGEFAIIRSHTFLYDGRNFLHYMGEIEGKGSGHYYIAHTEVDLECLP